MRKTLNRKITAGLTAICTMVTLALPLVPAQASIVSNTPREAVANYNKYLPAYEKREVPVVDSFRQVYDDSLADRVIARAIWYMEYGSMVYNHHKYVNTGQIDCSNFTQLVYGDFGIKMTSASWKYDQVGVKVPGVYGRKGTNGNRYDIVGLDKLRPGDIINYWDHGHTHIGHVNIYMGIINGKPRVIGASDGRPTAIGIDDLTNSWMGGRIHSVRRVLPSQGWNPAAGASFSESSPVIPTQYFLKPQHQVVMPNKLSQGF